MAIEKRSPRTFQSLEVRAKMRTQQKGLRGSSQWGREKPRESWSSGSQMKEAFQGGGMFIWGKRLVDQVRWGPRTDHWIQQHRSYWWPWQEQFQGDSLWLLGPRWHCARSLPSLVSTLFLGISLRFLLQQMPLKSHCHHPDFLSLEILEDITEILNLLGSRTLGETCINICSFSMCTTHAHTVMSYNFRDSQTPSALIPGE